MDILEAYADYSLQSGVVNHTNHGEGRRENGLGKLECSLSATSEEDIESWRSLCVRFVSSAFRGMPDLPIDNRSECLAPLAPLRRENGRQSIVRWNNGRYS